MREVGGPFGAAANLYLNSRESCRVLAHPADRRFAGEDEQMSPRASRKDSQRKNRIGKVKRLRGGKKKNRGQVFLDSLAQSFVLVAPWSVSAAPVLLAQVGTSGPRPLPS